MDGKIPMVTTNVCHPVAGKYETGAGQKPLGYGNVHGQSSLRLMRKKAPSRRCGTALPVKLGLALLVGFVSLQEVVQLSQESIAIDAVDHAGFLYGLTPGRGATQAMHADGEEQRSSVGCDVQNITDDGFFFNLNSHDMTSYSISPPIITAAFGKNKSLSKFLIHFAVADPQKQAFCCKNCP
jgi:hypothetical protein